MTFDIAPPSRNPTIDKKLRTVLRFVFKKLIQGGLDDMLPAIVIAYDRASNMATVQPLIQIVTTLNQVKSRDQIARVPVLQLGGGGFVLNFPIAPGNLGFIKANDRDISIFTQLWRMVQPNSGRMHSFSDGIFIPAVMTGFTIDGADSASVVLQKVDGSVRLAIGSDNVYISDDPGYAQNASAILDIQSTTKAFKFPDMTTGQKNAIASPQPGYAVFDLTLNRLSVYAAGTGWS